MAWDETLFRRVQAVLAGLPGARDRKMFGGICFTVQGRMACGILGDELIVRLDPGQAARALREAHVRPFDFTGRPMAGWVCVARAGLADDRALEAWVRRGVDTALALPPRDAAPRPAVRRPRSR